MEKEILVKDQKLIYNLKKSRRARRLRLTIYCDGSMVVTMPRFFSEFLAEKFIQEKSEWIFKKIKNFASLGWKKKGLLGKYSKGEYKKNKKDALNLINKRLGYFNSFYGFSFKRVSIRNQRTRWGSCSRSGNLNFNYKIMFLPEKFADYIIVHELCHIKEFNHSRRFWDLVAKTIPDCKKIIQELRGF